MAELPPEIYPPPIDVVPTSKIMVIDNAIDESTCRMLRDFAATKPRKPIGINYRDTLIIDHNEIRDQLNTILFTMITRHIEPVFGVKIEWWEKPQFLCYTTGCKYNVHSDGGGWLDSRRRTEGRVYNRDISLLLYINDNFTGGLLNFPDHNRHIQPKPGRLVAFPSTGEYRHAAEPTESGERFAIVTWAAAEGTPRGKERQQTSKVFTKMFDKDRY